MGTYNSVDVQQRDRLQRGRWALRTIEFLKGLDRLSLLVDHDPRYHTQTLEGLHRFAQVVLDFHV